MEEAKPLVMEKYDIEYRDTSRAITFYHPFGISRLRRTDQDP